MGPNADADAERSADHNHWLAANIQAGGSFSHLTPGNKDTTPHDESLMLLTILSVTVETLIDAVSLRSYSY